MSKMMKAVILEKGTDLGRIYSIRDSYFKSKGKDWDWQNIDTEEILNKLNNTSLMIFTQKFGEVDETDRQKLETYINK